ncbi:GGDEF domain-containing protein [Amycolatopsis nivea]|uniref:GGDEF domain-containing protein n=1 Tax=Amycolatopsis nivea TaxID=1644109 RepID=UPI001F0E69C2|nr:GGDEF domain-containing protein [Amycolatopsis nivea]
MHIGTPSRTWLPARWRMWSLPKPARAFVLVVDIAAVAAVVLAARSWPASGQWALAGWLAGCAVIHLHASHAIERIRRDQSHSPYVDLCSVWIFAGVLTLPPLLELGLIAVIYGHRWVLVNRFDAHRPPHRTVFTAATLALSATAATTVLHAAGHPALAGSAIRPDWSDVLVIIAAAAVQWTVNTVLVAVVIHCTTTVKHAGEALGSRSDNLLEVSQLALGVFVALALWWWPPAALLMIIPVLALHQCVLLDQLRLAARTDHRTGLLHAIAWQDQAKAELARVQAEHGQVAVLMIDLDWFKTINDTHGHLVGDEVLLKVAKAITTSVRRGDSVGRYGGEEFAVLLPGVDEAETRDIAERIRTRIHTLSLSDPSGHPIHLTATLGGAVYPDIPEESIEGLLRAADAALYAGKTAGRNRVALAAP